MQIIPTAKLLVGKIAQRGFFHVFGANVINKVVAFLANILVVRFMTKDDYGIFSYANSIYSVALLFTSLGMISAVLIYCAEKRPDGEKAQYYRYGLTRGSAVDVGLALVLFAIAVVVPLPVEGSSVYIALMAPLLLLDYVFQFESIALRSKKENRRFSALQIAQSSTYGALSCVGAYVGGVVGLIVARYMAYAFSVFLGAFLLRGMGLGMRGAPPLGKGQARGMWRYSIENGAAALMNMLLFQIDVIVVGLVLTEATSVAAYKVATMLPEGFLFIPGSVLVFAGPYFIEHNDDMRWFRRNAKRMFACVEAVMLVIAAGLIAFAEPVITLLWGDIYLDSVSAFRIMALTLLVSPLRTVCVNLLACLRMTRENLVVSVIGLAVNVILVYLLTVAFGLDGAAWTTVIVTGVTAAVSACIMDRRTRELGDSKHFAERK